MSRWLPVYFFTINVAFFVAWIAIAANTQPEPSFLTLFVILAGVSIFHNFLNLVHQASHQAVHKNRVINNGIGWISACVSGFSLAEFRATHLEHHKHLGIKGRDPDEEIVHTHALFLPFAVLKHDLFFWKNNLWKQNKAGISYIITRCLQILLVAFLLVNFASQFATFVLIPLLIVGFLNGLFLFYFPHYKPQWESDIRNNLQVNLLQKMFLEMINISRIYHEIHHNKPRDIFAYFPLYQRYKNSQQWKLEKTTKGSKYLL